MLPLMEQGDLSSLGFYCKTTLDKGFDSVLRVGVVDLIQNISNSDPARLRLKRLDLALCALPMVTHLEIRSKFPNLESLTVRKAFRAEFPSLRGLHRSYQWDSLEKLTTLQFHTCEGIYAADVPNIVALFPALRELLITTSGSWDDPIIGYHQEDWHLSPNTLCNNHQPLDWIHIEHMDGWELRALGIIPTKALIITCIQPQKLIDELKADQHLFPGMKVLRRNKTSASEGNQPNASTFSYVATLDQVCTARGVKVLDDAISLDTCDCCITDWY
ncbi:hypothetical protein CPB86DRAFT_522760 [Serendipita vermifera]|nr:hypothetical protein CPB86DRAFT_522760 [Serendipita vermifera]